MNKLTVVCCLILLLLSSQLIDAQQTGSVSGTVKDSSGGLIPGATITIAGDALIGGPRTAVSSETGGYLFNGLPPGEFTVTFELTGFLTLKASSIRVLVAQTTRVDGELQVGSLQETLTVTGAAPVVDVVGTTTQTSIDKAMFDSIPTSRNPWVMAGLVAGVVAQRLDVGGTQAMQQYNIEAYGSADSQKTSRSTV
jgi:hypothetical protein